MVVERGSGPVARQAARAARQLGVLLRELVLLIGELSAAGLRALGRTIVRARELGLRESARLALHGLIRARALRIVAPVAVLPPPALPARPAASGPLPFH